MQVSNLIYLDQPIGTGFSYTSSKQDLRKSTDAASVDFYDFLLAFFRKHPRFKKNDFYITGESYAGHYIPAFSVRIHQANKNNKSTKINLKGIAIGNGLTNPEIQFKAYADYALNMKLINQSYYTNLSKLYPRCQKLIQLCENNDSSSCLDAFEFCTSIYQRIAWEAGGIYFYDIRKKCEGSLCYDFSNLEKFLNLKSVKKSLGVGNINFVSFSTEVYGAMATDVMKNYMNGIPSLLESGVKVLVYAGEYDLICNWLGNFRWVHAMKWVGQKTFGSAPLTPFIIDGVKIGMSKSHGPLTFLKVHNAGHLVPMDQPKASLEMIKRSAPAPHPRPTPPNPTPASHHLPRPSPTAWDRRFRAGDDLGRSTQAVAGLEVKLEACDGLKSEAITGLRSLTPGQRRPGNFSPGRRAAWIR
ncbi:hypothetical protein RD792_003512 [Penstemon davidsonii]|uniref:Carboxypeptidase n=1 Tax=Penstemon davidsonii TaxID=160366 RepID=A0ABR0DU13_9LAMI|nr:hypothetical protein RD792_003512 [Penstemon davidsonii]